MFSSGVGSEAKWRSTLERALGTWESVADWADYIAYLARLQKAVCSSSLSGEHMPLCEEISESLARCLEPNLPSGVHQTCITVYDTVFTTIGPQRLCDTLNLWLPGILPVISWAAFNVKPMLIELIAKHVISAVSLNPETLQELIHPVLLALLPSLEEESGECYSEIWNLVNTLKIKLNDDDRFWKCIYMSAITSSDCRLGALNLLNSVSMRNDQLEASNEKSLDSELTSNENKTGISQTEGIPILAYLVRASCNGLNDSNVLVQRGFLDVLVRNLPIDSDYLQNNNKQFCYIMWSACSVILRRDMSLNRRLWLWLLGPEPEIRDKPSVKGSEEAEITGDDTNMSRLEYLQKYGSSILVDVLLVNMKIDPQSTFSIIQGLMDRWEIGVTVSYSLLEPVLVFCESLHISGKSKNPSNHAEQFFNSLEPSVVWSVSLKLLKTNLSLVLFMVQNFDVSDEEMAKHVPIIVLYLLTVEDQDHEGPKRLQSTAKEHDELLINLIRKIPHLPNFEIPTNPLTLENIQQLISNFYSETSEKDLNGEEQPVFPIQNSEICYYLLYFAARRLTDEESEDENPANSICEVRKEALSELLSRLPFSPINTVPPLSDYVFSKLTANSTTDCELFLHLITFFSPLNKLEYLAKYTQFAFVNSNLEESDIDVLVNLAKLNESLINSPVSFGVPSAISRILADNNLSKYERIEFFREVFKACTSTSLISQLETPLILFLNLAENEYEQVFTTFVKSNQIPQLLQLMFSQIENYSDLPALSSILSHFLRLINIREIELNFKKQAPKTLEILIKLLPTDIDANVFRKLMLLAEKCSFNSIQLERILPLIYEDNKSLLSEMKFVHNIITSNVSVPSDVLNSFMLKFVHEAATETEFAELVFLVQDFDVSNDFLLEITNKLDSSTTMIQLNLLILMEISLKKRQVPLEILRICVSKTSQIWLSIQTSTTKFHLKTRVRKFMTFLCSENARAVVEMAFEFVLNVDLAVKFVHSFEGTKYSQTLEILMDLDDSHLNLLQAYLQSLELDILGDLWPSIQQFLSQLSNPAAVSPNSSTDITQQQEFSKLQFLVDLAPKMLGMRLKNFKKYLKEFSDVYLKILINEAVSSPVNVVCEAIQQLPLVFPDPDKQNIALTKLLQLYIVTLKDVPETIEILETCADKFGAGTKGVGIWTKYVGDFLFDESFSLLTAKKAFSMKNLINLYFTCDKQRLLEFQNKLGTYGQSSNVLFAWTSAKMASANLKRLALFVTCTNPNNLGLNVNKIVPQLSSLYAENAPDVFLLVRAWILKPVELPLVSFIVFKLQLVFTNFIQTSGGSGFSDPNNTSNIKTLVEACKLLDLALVMQAEQFQLFEWLFVSNSSSENLVGAVLTKLASNPEVPELIESKRANIFNNIKRRPLLPKRATEKDLPLFLARVSRMAFADSTSFQKPDISYCEEWVLADLF